MFEIEISFFSRDLAKRISKFSDTLKKFISYSVQSFWFLLLPSVWISRLKKYSEKFSLREYLFYSQKFFPSEDRQIFKVLNPPKQKLKKKRLIIFSATICQIRRNRFQRARILIETLNNISSCQKFHALSMNIFVEEVKYEEN